MTTIWYLYTLYRVPYSAAQPQAEAVGTLRAALGRGLGTGAGAGHTYYNLGNLLHLGRFSRALRISG